MVKSILLPIDMSDENSWRKALDVALEQVRLHKAALHVVSVLPDFGMSMVGGYFKAGFERDALKAFGKALTDWVDEHVPDDVDVHPHVLHGSIYDEILRAAQNVDADLIVIGSHRPKFKDYLLGPNAARVVRHARQSVYVVRN
ncbi:universal stress protein [Alkalilacustris brevis]|uniref:universal stress protein n=1 Tax=Alkalilacustris brevis TaxID=2026338 RepID=UPI000E0DE379|nr:universal stress protein [Alkalilacustris brevis]